MILRPLRAHSSELLRLDFLRFVAALGIMWHHAHEFLYPAGERAAIHAQTRGLALCVDLFFAISGFVISYVYADRPMRNGGYGRFLQRRVARLIPLHWLTFAIMWLFWALAVHRGLIAQHAPDLSARCSANALLLLHAVIPCGNGIVPNGVTWSISIEMLLYLAFPLLLALCRRRWSAGLWMAILACAGAWALVRTGGLWEEIHPLLRGAVSFSLGISLFLARATLARVAATSAHMLGLLALTLVLMETGAAQWLVLCGVYLLVAATIAADMRGPPAGLVAAAAPVGQMTYSLYLWHSLFIAVLLNALADKLLRLHRPAMAAMTLLCFAAVIATSYLSWTLFEGPARRWIDSLGTARRAQTPPAPVAVGP